MANKEQGTSATVFIERFSDEHLIDILEKGLSYIGWEELVPPNAKVFIKPNFTYPFYKPGVTTNPAVIESLVALLSSRTSRITIGESDGGFYAWKAEEAFQGHKLPEIAIRYGVNLVNLSQVHSEEVKVQFGSKTICVRLPTTSSTFEFEIWLVAYISIYG